MNIPRIQAGRRKRSHEIAELIETAIASGEFEVGTKLPSEKELAERYGVGRPSVREALFLLQQQGFVDVTSGARAQVTAPNSKFLSDQIAALVKRTASRGQGQSYMEQTRLLFEAGVAWQAAQCATAEDIERLKRALDANTAAMGNTAEFIRTDVAFHYELTVITRNPVFSAVHDILVQWLVDQRTTTIHMPDADRLSVRDHTAIYEAVAAHDPMRAFHEMTSHLRLISQLYTESKRLHDEIMRNVARDVAARIDREKEAMWSGLRGSARANRKTRQEAEGGVMTTVVLGAGAVGTATAWYLSKAGQDVEVVERRPEAALETSWGNGGVIHASEVEPWSQPGMPRKIIGWLGKENAPLLLRYGAIPHMWRWGLEFSRNCTPERFRANAKANLDLALHSLKSLQEIGVRDRHQL